MFSALLLLIQRCFLFEINHIVKHEVKTENILAIIPFTLATGFSSPSLAGWCHGTNTQTAFITQVWYGVECYVSTLPCCSRWWWLSVCSLSGTVIKFPSPPQVRYSTSLQVPYYLLCGILTITVICAWWNWEYCIPISNFKSTAAVFIWETIWAYEIKANTVPCYIYIMDLSLNLIVMLMQNTEKGLHSIANDQHNCTAQSNIWAQIL